MDKDKLQAWALTAEVVSGIAVVATLIFLAFEMRDNTNASQAQTYQILMREVNEYRKMLAEPELAEVFEKQRTEGWQSLDNIQKRQYRSLNLIIWSIYESAFFANKRGVLGESEWSRFDARLCDFFESSQTLWASGEPTSIRELHTEEFVEYVENLCR